MKLCCQCTHFRAENGALCVRNKRFSPVYGFEVDAPLLAENERAGHGLDICGPSGQYFKERVFIIKKQPKPKWWDVSGMITYFTYTETSRKKRYES